MDQAIPLQPTKLEISHDDTRNLSLATATFKIGASTFAVTFSFDEERENDVMQLAWEELHRVTAAVAAEAQLRAQGSNKSDHPQIRTS